MYFYYVTATSDSHVSRKSPLAGKPHSFKVSRKFFLPLIPFQALKVSRLSTFHFQSHIRCVIYILHTTNLRNKHLSDPNVQTQNLRRSIGVTYEPGSEQITGLQLLTNKFDPNLKCLVPIHTLVL